MVTMFGKSVGYSYLTWKLQTSGSPKEILSSIGLGLGCLITRFSTEDDLHDVLKGGP